MIALRAGAVEAYPPPPWRLRGRATLVPVPVRATVARAAGVPTGARLVSVRGWSLGGLLLGDYDETATLRYHELVVVSGLAAVRGRPAFVVSHIYVDSEASLAGGRAIWGLPKELATFTAADGRRVEIRRADGVPLVTVAITTRRRRIPAPLVAPILGTLEAHAARTVAVGRLTISPGHADVGIPPASPLASLGLHGHHAAIAGDRLDLPFPAPNVGASSASGIDLTVLSARRPG